MKRATRLVPPVTRSLRAPLLRPPSLFPLIQHAGPSTLPRRFLSTSFTLQDPTIQRDTLSQSEMTSQETTEEGPANVVFEEGEMEDGDEEAMDQALSKESERIHVSKFDGHPILLPLSSLASTFPTEPSPSGLAISLSPDIFAETVRRDILHRCVVWYRSTLRQGTHQTLGRADVAFSGKKLRPQKGTGRARLGDASSPMLRKGGMAFPKRPRDYAQDLPRKIRAMGMRIALSVKLDMGLLRVVDNLNEAGWKKTKDASKALSRGWYFHAAEEENFVSEENQSGETNSTTVGASETTSTASDSPVVEAERGSVEAVSTETTSPEVDASEQPASDFEESLENDEEIEYAKGEWINVDRFGPSDELSILFLHSPLKPAQAIWDFALPLRNIPGVEIMSTDEVEVYHILKYRWLVMEGDAVDTMCCHKGQVVADQEHLDELTAQAGGVVVSPKQSKSISKKSTSSTKLPNTFLLHKWRKIRGSKSMTETFGMKNASAKQTLTKRAGKRLRREGEKQTPDAVAELLAKRKNVLV